MKLADAYNALQQQLQQPSASATFVSSSHLKQYQQSIEQGMIAALSAIYPCVIKLIGNDCWQSLLPNYISQQAATSADISHIGAELPQYLSTSPIIQQVHYLAEVAKYEWQWYLCFHGDVGNSRFVQSSYPLLDIWQMCQAEYAGDYQLNHQRDHYSYKLVSDGKSVLVYCY